MPSPHGYKIPTPREVSRRLFSFCLSHTMTGRLSGKVAIITGAARFVSFIVHPDYTLSLNAYLRSSGIGFESAVLFAKEGAHVVCADLNEKGLKTILEKIETLVGPDMAIAVPTDVSKEEQVKRLVDTAVEKFGTLSKENRLRLV